jgi:hypothetical protein
VSWLWIFLPVALVVIAAVVGLPLWQSIWARERHEDHVRRDATPQSRPQHIHH